MTLADFLLARFAESSEYWRARRVRELDKQSIDRVLTDFEAKLRIVARHRTRREFTDCAGCGEQWPCPDLRDLARPYSDHPAYDESWRP